MTLIIRSKIREVVKRIDPQEEVSSIAADVGDTLELVVEDILRKAVDRAKKNQRRTLLARDL
ncbi:MAG: histone-like protein [Nanoarchaeota archaeon]